MANHPQALKRHRQSVLRRMRNKHYTATMKTAIKKVRTAIQQSQPVEEIEQLYRAATSTIHKTAQSGVIKGNAAGRYVGRLAKAIAAGPVAAVKPAKKKKRKK